MIRGICFVYGTTSTAAAGIVFPNKHVEGEERGGHNKASQYGWVH